LNNEDTINGVTILSPVDGKEEVSIKGMLNEVESSKIFGRLKASLK